MSKNEAADSELDLTDVERFFSTSVEKFGATPRGVDWNGPERQLRSLTASLQLFANDRGFSVTDLGCGYGALCALMREHDYNAEYLGIDISPAMIQHAAEIFKHDSRANFVVGRALQTLTDYVIASGIFAKRLDIDDEKWEAFMLDTIDQMDKNSRRGFAFNCLTSYSDEDKKRSDLYYADPCWLFDLCRRKYSRNVALLHDYENWEFMIIVRK